MRFVWLFVNLKQYFIILCSDLPDHARWDTAVASETHMNTAPSTRIHEYIRAAGGRQDDSTTFDMTIPPSWRSTPALFPNLETGWTKFRRPQRAAVRCNQMRGRDPRKSSCMQGLYKPRYDLTLPTRDRAARVR